MRYLSLLLIIALAGCVELNALFGQTGTEEKKQEDVLVIRNVLAIPNSPVAAGSDFTLTFEVANVYQDPGAKEVKGSKIELYDAGRCTPDKQSKTIDLLYPGATEIISWKFKTPTNGQLGGLKGRCTMRMKLSYALDAVTIADLTVVSKETLERAERAGETLMAQRTQQKGAGPLKIDVSFDVKQPVLSETIVPVTIRLKDEGKGVLSGIEESKLSIVFENGLKPKCDYPTSEIDGKKVIPLINRVSPPIKCTFTAPKVTDTQTLFLRADVKAYLYEFHHQENIDVQPTFEGIK